MSPKYTQARATIGKLLSCAQNRDEIADLLTDLLTHAEVVDIAERIQILIALKNGKTQRTIAEELGISVTTVNRGSKILQQ